MKRVIAILVLALWSGTIVAEEHPREKERRALYQEVERLYAAGQHADAITFTERYIALSIAIDGEGSKDHIIGLHSMGNLYRLMGRFDKAVPYRQRAVELQEKQLGLEHLEVADSLNSLGGLYRESGEYEKAESAYRRALAIREKKLGPDHADTGVCLNNIGLVYHALARYGEAQPLYQRSLANFEKNLPPDHAFIANNLNNQAELFRTMGLYRKAVPLYLRSLAIREKMGLDHLDVANSLNNLALLYRGMGKYGAAEPLYLRSLSILKKNLGPEHPSVATGLANLGHMYSAMGQIGKSEQMLLRSLAIREKVLGPSHPDIANSLNTLALQYNWAGEYGKAEPMFLRSLAIREKHLGVDHPEVGTSLTNLASLYIAMGQFEKAEPHLQRGLAVFEKRLGPEHTLVSNSLSHLGILYESMGQYAKAEPLHLRALAIREKQLVPDHPYISSSLSNLASVYAAQGDWAKSLESNHRARRAQRRYLNGELFALSDQEQQAFLKQNEAELLGAYTLGLHSGSHAPLAAASAEWLLNFKGLLTEVRTERLRILRQAESDGAKSVAFPKEVGRAAGTETGVDPWILLPSLRKALAADSVLISIARFSAVNFKATGLERRYLDAHYVAWVIFPEAAAKDVVVVDLGEAAPIDSAVLAFRAVSEWTRGDDTTRALKTIASKVLQPLEPHIGSYARWQLSPDGDLWLIPWAALPLSDGNLAFRSHEINHLISGRELVLSGSKLETSAPAVLADPDYNLGAPNTAAPVGDEPLLITRSISFKGTFQQLPGTASEAERIRAPLAIYAKATPSVWLGAEASEANFMALKRPKVLVLCTHGFFMTKEEGETDQRTGERKPKPGAENPLVRCGLALAGANRREGAPAGDDGILSGLEIVQADLGNTDLVILSACQTALGEVNTGDGVAGLRQCFQLAGANSVLATLWRIPDAESADLMTMFLTHLAKGQRKSEALRNAQLQLVASRAGEGKSVHPFFWAAFTVTGR